MTVLAAVLAGSTNSTSSVNDVQTGLLGFLVVAALGLALVFLLRSMNKQFRKIGPRPEDAQETEVAAADEAPADEGRRADSGVAGAAKPGARDERSPRP